MESISNNEQLREAVKALHCVAPWAILAYYVIATTVSVCTLQTISAKIKGHKAPRKVILWIMFVVMVTYIGEASVHLSPGFLRHPRYTTPDGNIYLLSSVLVWLILTISLLDSAYPVWYPYYGSSIIALVTEVTLITLTISYNNGANHSEYAQISCKALRIGSFILLLGLLFGWRSPVVGRDKRDEESTPLLGHTQDSSELTQDSMTNSKYGSTVSIATGATSSSEEVELDLEAQDLKKEQENLQHVEDRLKRDGNWWTYARGFSVFMPYVWPTRQYSIQLCMVGVGVCLLCLRALNLLIPRQLGIIINALGDSQGGVPYFEVALYVFYLYLQSAAGIYAIKNWLWLPVEQWAYRAITTAAYNHIMGLSSNFHESKQSGELYKSIEQGSSVNDLLEAMLFEVLPMLIDLFVAFTYLYYLFDAYMALIVGTTTVLYLWVSTYFTAMQSDSRRRQMGISRKESQVLYDSMGNWRTVSYFNRIPYEEQRYSSVVTLHMQSQRKSWMLHYVSWAAESVVLDFGLAGACFLAAYQVASGIQSVGSFVTLFTYWGQLSGPLMFFSQAHVRLMAKLIDAEQLLQVFQTKPSVTDKKGAKKLNLDKGDVKYSNVHFSYDGKKQILKDLSFHAAAGQTVALIGETGGGKSTILKLLFRFYDVTSGSITIDGQDIRDVALESLRECIGVVPQDPSLFNDTIMNNVRYSRLDATENEVFDACKAAAIHNKITSFTNGYQSKVGEHGVMLSGGELQRVAIARAILKNSKMILLDEATSSVDTETERNIQEALAKLTSGRTTFVVAHRLSTIVNADLIIVIKDGQILERGTHDELFHAHGKYHDLWARQLFVAPGDTRKSDDSVIVNDLSADLNIQDLLKAAKKIPHHHHEGSDQQRPVSAEESVGAKRPDKEDRSRKGFLGSFGKKVWKPDAPDFVPQHLRETASKGGSASHEHSGSAHDHDHNREGKTGAKHEKRPVSVRGAVRQSANNPSASQPSLATQQQPQESQPLGQTQRERKRRFRSRRDKSKTEPPRLGRSQTDGTGDMEPGSCSQGQSIGNPSRRVSAPSDPPSAPTNLTNSDEGQPRRRQRHWRIKNREAARTQSTGGLKNWSTNSTQPGTPTAPSTSPIAGVPLANDLKTVSSSTGVRFVSGV